MATEKVDVRTKGQDDPEDQSKRPRPGGHKRRHGMLAALSPAEREQAENTMEKRERLMGFYNPQWHPCDLPNVIWTEEKITRLALDLVAWFHNPSHWFLQDFWLSKGMTKVRGSQLAARWPILQIAVDYGKVMQESRLLNLGMTGYLEPSIVRLVLTTQHGYKDHGDQEGEDVKETLPSSVKETQEKIEVLRQHENTLAQMMEDAGRFQPRLVEG